MKLSKETADIQRSLAKYCRSQNEHQVQGARIERLPTYRRLVQNIATGVLDKAYPISKKLLGSNKWKELSHSYIERYDSSSPYYWQYPKELIAFCSWEETMTKFDLPKHIIDLLTFEWLEIEVFMMKDIPAPKYNKVGDIKHSQIIANPETIIQRFSFPVFRPNYENEMEESEFFLAFFRDPKTLQVKFSEISLNTALLLKIFLDSPATLPNALEAVCQFQEIDYDENTMLNQAKDTIENLIQDSLILGFKV